MNVHDITYPNQWCCPPCVQSLFVYDHYENNDCFHNAVIEGILDCSFQYHEMNNKVFMPFDINERSDTPFTEIDPDFHVYTTSYSIKHTKCDYFTEDTLVDKFTKSVSFDRNLSVFHLNIKSFSKLYGELEMYLDSLRFPFYFIGLTETWLDECKENLFELLHYVSVTRSRNTKRGLSTYPQSYTICVKKWSCLFWQWNGVCVYRNWKECITFQYQCNHEVVYRTPDSSVDILMRDWLIF